MPETNQTLMEPAPVDIAGIIDALECDPLFLRELAQRPDERIEWLQSFVPAAPEFV